MKYKIHLEQQLAICFAASCFLLVGIFAGTHFAPALLTAQDQPERSNKAAVRLPDFASLGRSLEPSLVDFSDARSTLASVI
jgi:hypothetical protein